MSRIRACKLPIFCAIRFHARHALVITEAALEQCVNERGYSRTLSDNDERYKQKKNYEHGQEPPALVAPEESEQLGYDTDIKGGFTEESHGGRMTVVLETSVLDGYIGNKG